MRTTNPALNSKTFVTARTLPDTAEVMTISGTVNKIGGLTLCVALAAGWVWAQFLLVGPGVAYPYLLVGSLGGFGVALVTIAQHRWAPVTAPLYALLEGLVIGGGAVWVEAQFPGIAFQAASLTFGVLAAMLIAYRTGLVKATEHFKLGVASATLGIALVYLADLALGLFGLRVPYLHQTGLIGIIASLFILVVAALNLVLDFDFIVTGAQEGAPRHMEWYAAFGLMVTLIWIYWEMLRLLIILQSDND